MTSVEIRKKFLAYRQYKLRGVDQVDNKLVHVYYSLLHNIHADWLIDTTWSVLLS